MTKVLLASRNADALRALQKCLEPQREFVAQTRLLTNGSADPLEGLAFQPDIVVLRFDTGQLAELAAWTHKGAAARPPLIVVGPAGQAEAMRLAIRSGAKDFLPEPIVSTDLIASLTRVREEVRAHRVPGVGGRMIAIVGAAGGVGTSFVAANLARILAGDGSRAGQTAPILVDLDLNFAPQTHYLDLHPERGLIQAIEAVDTMDAHALAGFGAEHRSGFRLLCATGTRAVLSKELALDKLSRLLDLLTSQHRLVLVDLPHVLDGVTATILGLASEIVIVMQQSVLHVRNITRMLQILKTELGVSTNKIRLVVNRYQKEALVQLEDIQRGVSMDNVMTIPSHYRSALESVDTGVPLYDSARDSPVVRALQKLAAAISGEESAERVGLLQRVLPGFLRN